MGAVRERQDGKVEVGTMPDSRTGARLKVLDQLDFIHVECQQIPDAKLHQVRYYGHPRESEAHGATKGVRGEGA